MKFHLEHALRLHIEPERKNYTWAINEIDAQGKPIGRDQIPWNWQLWFSATSCQLCESVDIRHAHEIVQRRIIRVRLRSGAPRYDEDEDYFREAAFSMFGTDRIVKKFQLDIHPTADPDGQERCTAWGSVSYTTEVAFRHETTDDCIVFHLSVKPELFARYSEKIARGSLDQMLFCVGQVDGFYSEWSPSIFARNVKVLTSADEHKVDLPADHQLEPPRLGHVGEAELYVNRRLELVQRAPKPKAVEETERAVPETRAPAAMDQEALQMLRSLRHAVWFVVGLVALILTVTVLRL